MVEKNTVAIRRTLRRHKVTVISSELTEDLRAIAQTNFGDGYSKGKFRAAEETVDRLFHLIAGLLVRKAKSEKQQQKNDAVREILRMIRS
jgi:hypothetical protein